MHAEITIKISDIDNFMIAHKDDFEYDVQESVDELFVVQGIDYEKIDFEFKYQISSDELEGVTITESEPEVDPYAELGDLDE